MEAIREVIHEIHSKTAVVSHDVVNNPQAKDPQKKDDPETIYKNQISSDNQEIDESRWWLLGPMQRALP